MCCVHVCACVYVFVHVSMCCVHVCVCISVCKCMYMCLCVHGVVHECFTYGF